MAQPHIEPSARRSFNLVKKRRVQSRSPPFGPAPTKARFTPYLGTQAVKRRYSAAYSSGVKLPPQPQDSLPTPQKRTLKGSRSPPAARFSAGVVLPAGELQYSTHS